MPADRSIEIHRLSLQIERGNVTARTHARIMRNVLRAASEYHVAHHLPRHFEDNPKTRPGGAYRYARRTKAYLARKWRMVGHEIPMVLSGGTRIAVLGSAAQRITATQHRSRIYMRGNFPMRRERWDEIKAIVPIELRKLMDVSRELYRREARKPENRARRTVRI